MINNDALKNTLATAIIDGANNYLIARKNKQTPPACAGFWHGKRGITKAEKARYLAQNASSFEDLCCLTEAILSSSSKWLSLAIAEQLLEGNITLARLINYDGWILETKVQQNTLSSKVFTNIEFGALSRSYSFFYSHEHKRERNEKAEGIDRVSDLMCTQETMWINKRKAALWAVKQLPHNYTNKATDAQKKALRQPAPKASSR